MTPLPPMDRVDRFRRVRQQLAADGRDGFVVSNPVNIRWLTGFTGSNGIVLTTHERAVLVTDGRYDEQAAVELATGGLEDVVEVEITSSDVGTALAARIDDRSVVGFESDHLTVDRHQELGSWFPSATLSGSSGLLGRWRQDKDEAERARLRAAAGIADEALAACLPLLRAGTTERGLGLELERAMLERGADGISFETIVASGPNSSKPHARPSDRPFGDGDLVILDFGASVDGYGSDMTRTFVVGGQPTGRQAELYDAVRAAQQAGVEAVADGVEEREIDRICRSALAERGLGDLFIHGTGHGIGLEIHEQPILSTRSTGRLRAGLVVTVEPGVYEPSVGGVRIEDSVVVTDTGCEPITHSPKTLSPAAAA